MQHKSLNAYHGVHALRERAKKLKSHGIMIIRFELPWNIWCGSCGIHAAQGTRYNAEKKCVGKYFSTKLWNFRMRCRMCKNHFEIETDPEHRDYKCVKGCQRKCEEWTPEDAESQRLKDVEEAKKLALDPIYKLEHGVQDQKKAKVAKPALVRLREMKNEQFGNDYQQSSLVRKMMRKKRRATARHKIEHKRHMCPDSVPLLPASEEDAAKAKSVLFHGELLKASHREHRQKARLRIQGGSIFGGKSKEGQRRLLLAQKRRAVKLRGGRT